MSIVQRLAFIIWHHQRSIHTHTFDGTSVCTRKCKEHIFHRAHSRTLIKLIFHFYAFSTLYCFFSLLSCSSILRFFPCHSPPVPFCISRVREQIELYTHQKATFLSSKGSVHRPSSPPVWEPAVFYKILDVKNRCCLPPFLIFSVIFS